MPAPDCISTRALFGGYGLYYHDAADRKTMFALVADDILYFKTDKLTRPDFDKRSLPAFSYRKKDREYTMSYHEAPAEVFDDPDEMRIWVHRAIAAALRAKR